MAMLQQAQQGAPAPTAAAPGPAAAAPAQPQPGPGPGPGPGANFGEAPPPGAEVSADAPKGEEATPEEQKDYDRALKALHTVLYTNEGTSQAVVDMLQPEDKIGSVVKAGVMLVQQLDEKLDMDENIIAEITTDTADRLIEMAERVKGMQFSDQEAQAVAGATWEGVMQLFGVDQEQYDSVIGGMSSEELDKQKKTYESFLGGPQNG